MMQLSADLSLSPSPCIIGGYWGRLSTTSRREQAPSGSVILNSSRLDLFSFLSLTMAMGPVDLTDLNEAQTHALEHWQIQVPHAQQSESDTALTPSPHPQPVAESIYGSIPTSLLQGIVRLCHRLPRWNDPSIRCHTPISWHHGCVYLAATAHATATAHVTSPTLRCAPVLLTMRPAS